jgi:hypothetical protein
MRNIVVVLGAGASFEYKAPLMRDFYKIATSIYVKNPQDENLKRQFDIVFDFIDKLQKAQAKANLDLHNIESVYTALEMAKLLKLDNLKRTLGQSWKELDIAMKYFLTKTIESQIEMLVSDKLPNIQQSNSHFFGLGLSTEKAIDQAIFNALALIKNGWNVTFVTFNYDIVVESILAYKGYSADYCLKNDEALRDQDPVKVLKLHGSINWEKVESTENLKSKRYVIKSIPIFGNQRRGHSDPYYHVSKDNKVTTTFSESIVPVVVPPVWNKSSYHGEISEIWREAADAFAEATHIYCLGYSLPETDGFFKQLFALGTVGTRPLQEFAVFDVEKPNIEGGVESRFRNMLGRGSENVFEYYDNGAEGLVIKLKGM